MFNQQYSEFTLNARLVHKLKKGILYSSSFILLSLGWLIFGQGASTCGPYQVYAAGAFFVAGACFVAIAPYLFIMLIQLRRLSLGGYELSASSESIMRIHRRGGSLVSQEQWLVSNIQQVCISRSALGREQALETRMRYFQALFSDEHYYSVYLVDVHYQEHWLLTGSDGEEIRRVYQALRYLLPHIPSQDYVDEPARVLRPPLWLSVCGTTHTRMRSLAMLLFFAGMMLTFFSLMSGVLAYNTYINGEASGAWMRSTGTIQNQRVVTKVTDDEERREIHATVHYPRHTQMTTKEVELSEERVKQLGIAQGDTPRELAVYWQEEHPEKLRLSPPLPASRPFYFILLSLVLFMSQVIPLSMLRGYQKAAMKPAA